MQRPVCKYCREEAMHDPLNPAMWWCPNCSYTLIGVDHEEEKTSEGVTLHQLPCALQEERRVLAGMRGESETRD